MNINAVEGFWLGANLVAGLVTFLNLLDAWSSWRASVRTTRAREVLSRANVRREIIQLLVVVALIVVVLPALSRPGDTPLTPIVLSIMAVPIGIALNSELDRRTRRTVVDLLERAPG